MKTILCLFLIFCTQAFAHDCYPAPMHPNLMELSTSPRVFYIPQFLSPSDCEHIIAKARPLLARSTVVDNSNKGSVLHQARTSEGMFFPQFPQDRVLRNLEERIASITGIPRENGEALQVLHYEVGQEYQPHHDYFDPATPGGKENYDRGGQRIATFMVYLRTTEEGGETVFPHAHIGIKPVQGDAVLFYNCFPNGQEDVRTLHGGAPVLKGEKWIVTKWLRKGKFR